METARFVKACAWKYASAHVCTVLIEQSQRSDFRNREHRTLALDRTEEYKQFGAMLSTAIMIGEYCHS